MFEHHTEKPLPFSKFLRRMGRLLLYVLVFIGISLLIGTVGYRATEGMGWLDAFYNASLILSGMGPAWELQHPAAKIFASIYALYSGLCVIIISGVLLAPIFHRVLHIFHVQTKL